MVNNYLRLLFLFKKLIDIRDSIIVKEKHKIT